jgi:acetoin utilization deacetylase AcuC-like enzyme
LVELIVAGEVPCGFSAHRPPGHHAESTAAMGFCLFNNVAVAAQHAIERLDLERVMIIDWDVHHGNGTNDIFHRSDRVLYLSIHQSPLYPGTGPASDAGSGDGTGFTVNLPVPPGTDDLDYRSLVQHVAVPLVRAFRPQLLLISAGYDAHRDDPLADCRVTEDGFAAMAGSLRRAGDEVGAPVGCVLEGGYALEPLGRSVVATIQALLDSSDEAVELTPLADTARRRLTQWWPQLG